MVISLGIFWSTAGLRTNAPAVDENGEVQKTTYESALDSAREVTGQASRSSNVVFVYDGISYPDDTTAIDLSGRNLSGSLKAEIRQIPTLEVLDISNNNFTGVPAEVGQLKNLRILNLSNNPLTGLPRELANLPRLEILDVSGTDYSEADLAVIRAGLPVSANIITQ